MVPCAYCERVLICDACGEEYNPPSREHHEALSRPEVPVLCRECIAVFVCRWCKTPYDGSVGDASGDPVDP